MLCAHIQKKMNEPLIWIRSFYIFMSIRLFFQVRSFYIEGGYAPHVPISTYYRGKFTICQVFFYFFFNCSVFEI